MVVLPAPFGPSRPVTAPSAAVKVTPSTACTSPNRLCRFSTRIILNPPTALAGQTVPYETIAGRAWGELDPNDPQNALITDIALAPKNANGKVEYISSFFIVKPVDMAQASGLMWHDVPNRGGRITITTDLRNLNDVGLSSAWQGDNAGATVVPANAADIPGTPPFGTNEWVKVPVLTGVTGRIFGRIINRSGSNQPLNVMGNPIPYFPANSADNAGAVLKTILKETIDGVVTVTSSRYTPRSTSTRSPGVAASTAA